MKRGCREIISLLGFGAKPQRSPLKSKRGMAMNQNENPAPKRENFASRLGFLLVSAGCAIGIGNVWRLSLIHI
mgnify:CR=1 FL=1